MAKSFFQSVLLLCLLMLTSCTRTEAALTDEPAAVIAVQTAAQPAEPRQAPVQAAQVIPARSQSQTASTAIRRTAFPVRRCMNLGNALEAPREGDWGYTIRARDLRAIAAAGFDTIRLPVRWDTHTAHRPPYEIDAAHMARVTQVVQQAQSAGLGVILDVHHYENLMINTPREMNRFLAIWDQIGRSFSRAPRNVYFEVLNEPTLDMSMAELNMLYDKVIPIIRRSNPERTIILGGNSWNSVEQMPKVKWPDDPNIVATFHDYGPHEFTHQGAEWMQPPMPMGRKWGGRADQADLTETYTIARTFKAETGIPVLVGEFGVIDKVPLAQRNAWTKTRRKAMEQAGFSWCAWDFSGAFKTYDVSAERWLPGTLDALFGP